eukprot:TRINITY_DN2757_c0_g1_i1.p1 TRINITY_DN2757_c0_g1~~TRINITY_DN2757_c0_g1_i1.p1  ORF type:complete len:117 (-),score=19.63 TRINITY_DN2757_c0_g1_i1:72-422(-)
MDIKEAEQRVLGCKKGSFLVRFSSRNQSSFTITYSHKKEKNRIVHNRIPPEFKYDLEKFVKICQKQKIVDSAVPGSPYSDLFQDKRAMYICSIGGTNSMEDGENDSINDNHIVFIP